jgi:hypothetical protein
VCSSDLYPPQEGIAVGDVFVMVAPIRDAVRKKLADYPDDTFAGRTAKIGSIDMTAAILKAQSMLELPATSFNSAGRLADIQTASLDLPSVAPAAGSQRLRLYEVSFPTAVISSGDNTGSALSWFSADISSTKKDAVAFAKVQTLAAPAAVASVKLMQFCVDEHVCESDKILRKVLSYANGEQINSTYDDNGTRKYVFDLEIFVVYQIYTTREIHVSSNLALSNSLSLMPVKVDGSEDGGRKSNALALGGNRGTDMQLEGLYQSPLTFGYRKVGFKLPRDMPPKADEKN